MASVNIQPLEDKILVQANEAETTTASGIVIPDTAKEKPQEGTVLAVGPGRVDDNGNRDPDRRCRGRRRHLLEVRRHRGQVLRPGVPDPVRPRRAGQGQQVTRGGPTGGRAAPQLPDRTDHATSAPRLPRPAATGAQRAFRSVQFTRRSRSGVAAVEHSDHSSRKDRHMAKQISFDAAGPRRPAARRRQAGRRGQDHPRPARPVCGAGQEVRWPDGHQRRRHHRP